MAKYLGIFRDTVDEIVFDGFVVMTDREMESFEELATSITWGFSYDAVSTMLEYDSGEDLLSRIDFKEITNSDYDSLVKVFNGEFGMFIGEFFLKSVIEEDDSDSDDDDVDYETYY
jgi:hypothetical protein